MLVQMSTVYFRHLGESVDKFCSDILKVCVKCMSVAVYMWLPAEIGGQACCYKFACIFYEKCWVMLLKFWHEKIAFVLEINKS
jgi:hypothetical protein